MERGRPFTELWAPTVLIGVFRGLPTIAEERISNYELHRHQCCHFMIIYIIRYNPFAHQHAWHLQRKWKTRSKYSLLSCNVYSVQWTVYMSVNSSPSSTFWKEYEISSSDDDDDDKSTSLPAARTSRLPQLARTRLGSQEWLNKEATTWKSRWLNKEAGVVKQRSRSG